MPGGWRAVSAGWQKWQQAWLVERMPGEALACAAVLALAVRLAGRGPALGPAPFVRAQPCARPIPCGPALAVVAVWRGVLPRVWYLLRVPLARRAAHCVQGTVAMAALLPWAKTVCAVF